MNTFIKIPKKKTDPSSFDTTCSKDLEDSLRQAKMLRRPIKTISWANQFRLLREQDETDQDTITAVLAWYLKNLEGQYIPRADSAKKFREKFPALLIAMERTGAALSISEDATKIAEGLSELYWPMGSTEQLAKACQVSLDNYRAWLGQRNHVLAAVKEDEHMVRFVRHLCECLNDPPRHFVRGWMKRVNSQVCDWPEWSGNLVALAFTADKTGFRNRGRDIASRYCGCPDRWDGFMLVIKNEG